MPIDNVAEVFLSFMTCLKSISHKNIAKNKIDTRKNTAYYELRKNIANTADNYKFTIRATYIVCA